MSDTEIPVCREVKNKKKSKFHKMRIFEVMLVILIIIYGQKAIETLLKKESPIPFGGIVLAMTWGAYHWKPIGYVYCYIFILINITKER